MTTKQYIECDACGAVAPSARSMGGHLRGATRSQDKKYFDTHRIAAIKAEIEGRRPYRAVYLDAGALGERVMATHGKSAVPGSSRHQGGDKPSGRGRYSNPDGRPILRCIVCEAVFTNYGGAWLHVSKRVDPEHAEFRRGLDPKDLIEELTQEQREGLIIQTKVTTESHLDRLRRELDELEAAYPQPVAEPDTYPEFTPEQEARLAEIQEDPDVDDWVPDTSDEDIDAVGYTYMVDQLDAPRVISPEDEEPIPYALTAQEGSRFAGGRLASLELEFFEESVDLQIKYHGKPYITVRWHA